MALKRLCPKCNKIIAAGQKYCEEHANTEKQRHIDYSRRRRQDKDQLKYQKFYSSKEWITTRDNIKHRYLGICLYSYYILGELVYTDYVHHIEPLKDNWDKRVDKKNLIPLCASIHQKVHKEYDKGIQDKREMQKLLHSLLDRYNKEFGKG